MSQKARAEGVPPPSPECIALAKFLRYNPALKNRVGSLNGKRVEFFKGPPPLLQEVLNFLGKRVIRLLLSDTYKKKAAKSTLLPKIDNNEQAIAAFKLLLASLLVLRVEKVDAHHGHNHGPGEKCSKPAKTGKSDTAEQKKKKKKKKAADSSSTAKKPKPPQNLSIQREQNIFSEEDYFAWFYETTGWQTILGGIGIVIIVFAAILFPLWPPIMRTGVWYLSIACLGFIAGIAVLSVVRLILFIVTMFAVPPGIWLFPNLFEDVGFFESFVPLWAWQKQPKKKKKQGAHKVEETVVAKHGNGGDGEKKNLHTTVEDGSDDE